MGSSERDSFTLRGLTESKSGLEPFRADVSGGLSVGDTQENLGSPTRAVVREHPQVSQLLLGLGLADPQEKLVVFGLLEVGDVTSPCFSPVSP